MIEHQLGQPVTLLRRRRLADARLLTEPDLGLMPLQRERKAGPDGKAETDAPDKDGKAGGQKGTGNAPRHEAKADGRLLATAADAQQAEQPEKPMPWPVSGALAHAAVTDPDHWLAAGIAPTMRVLVAGSDIHAPVPRDKGQTVLRFEASGRLVASGLMWAPSRAKQALKPFVVAQQAGLGQVAAFTQDPNFRAMLDGLNLLIASAIFRGPALMGAAYAAETQAERRRPPPSSATGTFIRR